MLHPSQNIIPLVICHANMVVNKYRWRAQLTSPSSELNWRQNKLCFFFLFLFFSALVLQDRLSPKIPSLCAVLGCSKKAKKVPTRHITGSQKLPTRVTTVVVNSYSCTPPIVCNVMSICSEKLLHLLCNVYKMKSKLPTLLIPINLFFVDIKAI